MGTVSAWEMGQWLSVILLAAGLVGTGCFSLSIGYGRCCWKGLVIGYALYVFGPKTSVLLTSLCGNVHRVHS
jgi:hypothetical protein